jgi:hypothetical protein
LEPGRKREEGLSWVDAGARRRMRGCLKRRFYGFEGAQEEARVLQEWTYLDIDKEEDDEEEGQLWAERSSKEIYPSIPREADNEVEGRSLFLGG